MYRISTSSGACRGCGGHTLTYMGESGFEHYLNKFLQVGDNDEFIIRKENGKLLILSIAPNWVVEILENYPDKEKRPTDTPPPKPKTNSQFLELTDLQGEKFLINIANHTVFDAGDGEGCLVVGPIGEARIKESYEEMRKRLL